MRELTQRIESSETVPPKLVKETLLTLVNEVRNLKAINDLLVSTMTAAGIGEILADSLQAGIEECQSEPELTSRVQFMKQLLQTVEDVEQQMDSEDNY